ncbi:hypothetical protein EC844_1307 [Acinetobacter calcoaceticus]|uniref:Lipoprotein n=1 Tax=Acinetobacter calcoaceticus TaxID=471 RepID=A0A4R1XB30_ACICA|nr:hypothetical protein EC844_1307 [Acinetobacter calcoaceticus]
MKYAQKVLFSSAMVSMLLFTACSDFANAFSPMPRQKVLKHPNGNSVQDCGGGALPIRGDAESFWRKNNLPKGTTEFVCVDGKAYLPGQEPKK